MSRAAKAPCNVPRGANAPSGDAQCVPILILGIGNILLRDEGVGVRVVEALRGRALPDAVELVDGGTGGADLLEVVADRRVVIVVDAAHADARPGTVFRCTAEELVQHRGVQISAHDIGLLETLRMARHLGCAPQNVVVFGITPKELTCGLELSQEVAETVPKVVELVLSELQDL